MALSRPTPAVGESPHLMLIDAGRRRRIVAIIAPGGMIEVHDKVAVVRHDCLIENETADADPIAEPAPLKELRTMCRSLVRNLDMKDKGALWCSVPRS